MEKDKRSWQQQEGNKFLQQGGKTFHFSDGKAGLSYTAGRNEALLFHTWKGEVVDTGF